MATTFPYKIQARGEGLVEHYYTGQEMQDTMDIYHQNLDDKGLWIVDRKTGYLRVNSNQKGLSARFSREDYNKRDYYIRSEVIPSATDNDSFGIIFRYQDRYRYYFVGWDGGGEYLWGDQTLRLYKMVGETYVLLGSAAIGPWVGGVLHQLDVDVVGNEFVITVNGIEVIRAVDNNQPYLNGAFGPCATSQVASWKSFYVAGNFDFMVEQSFAGEIDQINYNYETSKRQSPLTVAELMETPILDYGARQGYLESSTVIHDYTVSTTYTRADIHFDTSPPATFTTDGNSKIRAFMLSTTTPPIPPTNFKGTTRGEYIVWSWDDLVPFEEGFEILNEAGRVIASLPRDVTEWREGPLALGTEYTRKLRAYNRSGRSREVEATATTEALPAPPEPTEPGDGVETDPDTIVYSPFAPKNLRGITVNINAITWYWDKVENANYYQIWDAENGDLLGLVDTPRFREDFLTPDTLYRRVVTATNIAGTSGKSNEAMAFTDAVPTLPDLPPAPRDFSGEAIDEKSILWTWQAPIIYVDNDVLTEESKEATRKQILDSYYYRIYDANGEVLYEAPPGVFEWIETGLEPNVAYTHSVKVYTEVEGVMVEGIRSNYAYAMTLPLESAIEDEEESLPWPPLVEEIVTSPIEEEPKERIDAFYTGIGDNLDLKVRAAGERPKYVEGMLRRSAATSYREGKWPIGVDFDGGIGGGIGTHGDWKGWGPGNRYGGGHDPIGHIGYAGYNPDYGINKSSRPIGHTAPNDAKGYPGYMEGAELGVCSVDSPRESFTYDVQVQGTEQVEVEVLDKQEFEFRFKGEGYEVVRDYRNGYTGQAVIRPTFNLTFDVVAELDVPEESFETYYKITTEIEELTNSELSFNVRPYVDVLFSRLPYTPTTEEVFKGPDGVMWGPNTWVYNTVMDEVTTTQNVSWSGFYNRQFLESEDYSIEFEMGVTGYTIDDDFMGFAFRITEGSAGRRSFYFFGTDAGGIGLGGKWGLYKTVNAPNYPSGDNETHLPNTTLLKRATGMADNWERGRVYKVKIEVQGSNIKVYVDDVLVINHDDTSFTKGSWGPTTASQQGVMYRNFTFLEGTQKRIYGTTIYETIKLLDANIEEKAVQITPPGVNLHDMFAPAVTAAYNSFISSTGLPSARLIIRGYDATISRDNLALVFDKENGSSGIYVYAKFFYPGQVEYKTVTRIFEEPRFIKTVNASYSSDDNAYLYDSLPSNLAQGILEGRTYVALRSIRKFKSIDEYLFSTGTAESSVKIKKIEPVSLNPNVHVFADAFLRMYAWVSSTTTWTAKRTFKDTLVQHTDGQWILMDFDYQSLLPLDEHGNVYSGDMNKVVYRIVNTSSDYDVAFSVLGAKKLYVSTTPMDPLVAEGTSEHTYAAPDFPKIRYRVNREIVKTFSGTTSSALAAYVSPATLVPEIGTYIDADIDIQLTSSDGDVWLAVATDDAVRRRAGEDTLAITAKSLLLIGTEGKSVLQPWSGYSQWYKGTVNGIEPFENNGDGRRDYSVPISFDGPSGITINTWHIETRGGSGIELQLASGAGTTTTNPNDTVRFYSETTTKKTVVRKHYGPSYSVTHPISLCGTNKVPFGGQVPSPDSDPNLSALLVSTDSSGDGTSDTETETTISSPITWETVITTRNPNVAIRLISEPNYDERGELFLPIQLEAWIVNPIQVPWSPLVHNGYYYLNQREHFLYADTSIKGRYAQSYDERTIEIPYTIRVYCERWMNFGDRTWTDTARTHFKKGATSLTDIDSVPGQIMLAKDMNGEYYSFGTYVSENKKLPVIASEWGEIEWDTEAHGTSRVKVETSSMDMTTGTWSVWEEATNGDVIPSPLSDTIRYRVTLMAGEEAGASHYIVTDYEYLADWHKGKLSGVTALTSGVVMTNETITPSAYWLSDVIDLGEGITDLGSVTWREILKDGSELVVETMSAPNAAGPWNGSGEPWLPVTSVVVNPNGTKKGTVISNVNRYLRVRFTFKRGRKLIGDQRVDLSGAINFAKGINQNVEIVSDYIKLSDATEAGAYITPAMTFASVDAFKKVLLDATVPSGGELTIYTMTAHTEDEFDSLQMDETNWLPLIGDEVQSAPLPYIKVKVELTPGIGLTAHNTVTVKQQSEWLTKVQTLMNAKVDGSSIVMESLDGMAYIESKPFDFIYVESWLDVVTQLDINNGNIRVLTSTAGSSYEWEEWKVLESTGDIASTPNRYIRFRVELIAGFAAKTATKSITDISTGSFSNMEATPSGTGLMLTKASLPGSYISDVFTFENANEYKTFISTLADAVGASVTIYTRTSPDGMFWDAWESLGTANKINSIGATYFQYRIDMTAGSTRIVGEKLIRDTSPAGMKQEVYISQVFDFDGEVTALDRLFYESIHQSGFGSFYQFYTATGDAPDFLDGTETWDLTTSLNNTIYDINSPPKRYIAYKMVMTKRTDTNMSYGTIREPWFGTHSNTEIVDGYLVLRNPAEAGEYISDAQHFAMDTGRVEGYVSFKLNMTGAHTGGEVEVYYKIAATLDDLAMATEALLTTTNASTTVNISGWPDQSFVQYRIVITPGQDTTGDAGLPVVTGITTEMYRYSHLIPDTISVSFRTTEDGHKGYVSPKIDNLAIAYSYNEPASPRLREISISAMSTSPISPRIHKISAIGDKVGWSSPRLESVSMSSSATVFTKSIPALKSITLSGTSKERVVEEEHTISLVGSIIPDKNVYQLSANTMSEIVDEYFNKEGINEARLIRKRYEVFSHLQGIAFSVQDKNLAHYRDGLSPVFAQITSPKLARSYTQTRFYVDDKAQVLLSPIPQQGAPVIIKNAAGEELVHVAFMDDDKELTLWYTGYGNASGTQTFLLDHPDFDPATLEIEVDEDPNQPYTKLVAGEDYVVHNNTVTFRKVYDEDVVIFYKYILHNSFIMDYNYDVANGQALLTIHKPALNGVNEIEVTYETALDTAYYQATELDLNPMRNVLNEGFIYLTNDYHAATKLSIRFNPNTLHANGKDRTTINILATDRYGNPVVGDTILLTASDGVIDMKSKVTDMNGMVTAIYTASTTAGEVTITVVDTTAHLEAEDIIYLRDIHPQPRAEIVLSAQEITSDGMDRVKVTARIVNENQQQAVLTDVMFEVSAGGTLDMPMGQTNFEGEVHNYVRISAMPPDNFVTIKITAPEYGAVGYANLLIKEVAQFV